MTVGSKPKGPREGASSGDGLPGLMRQTTEVQDVAQSGCPGYVIRDDDNFPVYGTRCTFCGVLPAAHGDKIKAEWRILPGTFREATFGDLRLVVTNRRTRAGWGPVIWWVFRTDGSGENAYDARVAGGEVYQGVRYQSLVEQAMYEAEQAATTILRGGAA